jgi:sugar phosphate isomerase/epimerase
MTEKGVNMRSAGLIFNVAAVVISLFLSLTLLGGHAWAAEKTIVLNKYPDLKIGFTTANFLRVLPVTLENSKKLVDVASDLGFSWIELRDPGAVLTLDECRQLADYARGKKIEIGYAMAAGLMDANFWEIYSRGLSNAAVFDGPRTARASCGGNEFNLDPKKTAWTLKELFTLVTTADKAANQAKTLGLRYATENANEVIKGDGITSFGFTEFLANVNPNVGLQFDTGNFHCVSRVWTKPEDARAFFEKYIGKLAYTHLKASSSEHKPLPVLGASELDLDIILSLMAQKKVPWVAIELAQAATFDECVDNHKKTIEYLLKTF